MLTYVQNRVNMNDPESLYELALELGNAYEASAEDISAYRMYKEELTNAFDKFKEAYNNYNNNKEKKAIDKKFKCMAFL